MFGNRKTQGSIKLPSECKDYDWREQFENPLVYKKINENHKEEKPVSVIKKEHVETVSEAGLIRKSDRLMQEFETAERDIGRVYDLAHRYKSVAASCVRHLRPIDSEAVLTFLMERFEQQKLIYRTIE